MTVGGKHPRLSAAVIVIILLCCPLLQAQTSNSGYQAPKDYATKWARNISLCGVIGAMGLIGYVLLFRRRHISSVPSQWLLFLGICILPFPMMVLGTAIGMEQAKDVSFCQNCHVMKRFVTDMKNPENNSLAAKHFKNRYIQRDHCYTCHTDYGLFGTMQAKTVGLGHIWKETTGSYSLPVKIARPYRFTICLDCHAQSLKFEGVQEHTGLVTKIQTGEAECTTCLGLAHAPREERGV
jgi:cytochrome c nitrite reductase small subunit